MLVPVYGGLRRAGSQTSITTSVRENELACIYIHLRCIPRIPSTTVPYSIAVHRVIYACIPVMITILRYTAAYDRAAGRRSFRPATCCKAVGSTIFRRSSRGVGWGESNIWKEYVTDGKTIFIHI